MTINQVTVFADKLSGTVVAGTNKDGKPYTYLKGGTATIKVKDKTETVRIGWFGAEEALLNRGATIQLSVDLNEYEGKTYTQLSVRSVVPAFSNKNDALLTGKIVSFKEYNKVLSVELEISGRLKGGVIGKGIQKVTVFDKDSAVAQSIKANKGNEMLLAGTLAPSKGFTDYVITSASPVGAAGGADALAGVATASEVPAEEFPF